MVTLAPLPEELGAALLRASRAALELAECPSPERRAAFLREAEEAERVLIRFRADAGRWPRAEEVADAIETAGGSE